MLIEAFAKISPREDELVMMKQWLLMQKKCNSWSSTKATAEAVYALLLGAPADLLAPAATTVRVGETVITDDPLEAGTGYVQHVWEPEEMSPRMADIAVNTDGTTRPSGRPTGSIWRFRTRWRPPAADCRCDARSTTSQRPGMPLSR